MRWLDSPGKTILVSSLDRDYIPASWEAVQKENENFSIQCVNLLNLLVFYFFIQYYLLLTVPSVSLFRISLLPSPDNKIAAYCRCEGEDRN